MTPKQQRFVEEYLIDLNASHAGLIAGIKLSGDAPSDKPYVYLLVCPERKKILYVGKGRKDRLHQHLREARAGEINGLKKYKALRAYLDNGLEPEPVVFETCETDFDALRLERSLIKGIGSERLANSAGATRLSAEIAMQKAEDLLSKRWPLREWVDQYRPGPKQVSLYLCIRNGLEQVIADAAIELGTASACRTTH